MNQQPKSSLSKNNLRRLHGWARAIYPTEWHDRSAIVIEYLSQQDDEAVAVLLRKGWAEVFATAEREWPEAFAVLNPVSAS